MRWRDIVRKETGTEPVEAVKPLTPAASHKRAKRQLQSPHPPMPDLKLSRNQLDDVAAYILSLRKS